VYRTRVFGHLAVRWSAWFDGMAVVQDADGNTTLEESIIDQAALYGLIGRARERGFVLLTAQRVEAGG
jgi:hypothetical protein